MLWSPPTRGLPTMPATTFSDVLPPLHVGQLTATEFDVVPVAMILVAAALYLWGVVRVRRLRPRHPWPLGRTLAFIAAPLFAVGSPLALTYQASTEATKRWVARGLRSPVARFFDMPIVAFILYAVVIPITHLTVWYNYTLVHESVHNAEHIVFLVVGYLFWRQVFGIEPSEHRMHPGFKMLYLLVAVSVDTFVGLSLDSATHELFPAYTAMHRTWGPSLLSDLHIGGVIMWVGGDTLMMLAMIPVALEWLHVEERKAVRVDRELDAMLPGRGPGGSDQAPVTPGG